MPHMTAIIVLEQISAFFAEVLEFLNRFTGSFGWNVILLTVAFRIVVLPLSLKQTKSMIAMQRLQPQLKEIQKKYKDDREKQGQAMMALYKDNKVSPLGGCLPLLLQLPILFALFEVLRNTTKFVQYETNFIFLGINNLIAQGSQLWNGVSATQKVGQVKMYDAAKEAVVAIDIPSGQYLAVIALILLTIATGYVSSKMMSNDPKQAKMMALMPVVFGVFAWILPAGVTIYIIVTNVTMIIQQYIQLEAEGFYDEKRAQRMKTGEPLKSYERWRFKGYDYGSMILTALRIKNPAKLEKERSAQQKGAGKAKSRPAGEAGKQGKPAGGKAPAGKAAGRAPGGKPTGKPGAGKAAGGKAAKKPATGKAAGGKQVGTKGAPTDKSAGPGRAPGGQEPASPKKTSAGRDSLDRKQKHGTPQGRADGSSEKKPDEPERDRGTGEKQAPKPAGKPSAQTRQYPAKKKSSRKK